MAKLTVFIASRTEQENFLMEGKLKILATNEIRFSGVHPAGLMLAVDRLTGAVILNLGEWTTKDAALVQELRRAGHRMPILISAKADPEIVNRDIRGMSGVMYLPKPFENRELIGIVSKMLTSRTIPQQRHRRFKTQQDAEVHVESGSKLASRVCNLSKGGAYIEFMTPTPLKVGEYLTLKG